MVIIYKITLFLKFPPMCACHSVKPEASPLWRIAPSLCGSLHHFRCLSFPGMISLPDIQLAHSRPHRITFVPKSAFCCELAHINGPNLIFFYVLTSLPESSELPESLRVLIFFILASRYKPPRMVNILNFRFQIFSRFPDSCSDLELVWWSRGVWLPV